MGKDLTRGAPFDIMAKWTGSRPLNRDVAQMVARLVWDQDVAGSNPVIPTKSRGAVLCRTQGSVAQLVRAHGSHP